MRDVAALAGVSLKTVSRVINDEPGVKDEIRTRVSAAADRLDYRHNRGASNLRRSSGRTGSIGALVQDVSNSFSASLLRALEDSARARGNAVLAASLDEEEARERALVNSLVERRVDGLVIIPATSRQDYLAGDLRAGLPVVFVDRKPAGVDADSVSVDNVEGGLLATNHLLAQGHRRIAAILDNISIPTAEQRRRGYFKAHAARGVSPDPDLVVTEVRDASHAQEAADRLLALPDPPTAFFAGRNVISLGVARALAARGLRHSVAVVGFDDFPMADLLEPPLTVIRQDVTRIGRLAAELLFARIDGDTSAPTHVVLEPTLVCRGSGEIPPCALS